MLTRVFAAALRQCICLFVCHTRYCIQSDGRSELIIDSSYTLCFFRKIKVSLKITELCPEIWI